MLNMLNGNDWGLPGKTVVVRDARLKSEAMVHLSPVLVAQKQTPSGWLMLAKEVTNEAITYTPGSVLLSMDPVMWEHKGMVYSLETPGVPLQRYGSSPRSCMLQKPHVPPPGSVIIRADPLT